MATPQETAKPVDWVDKIAKAEATHLRKISKLKKEIQADETLPDLDRAVLGLTGSLEKLEEYKELAAKVGSLAGKPIITIDGFINEEGETRRVSRAEAGIMTGELHVQLHEPSRVYDLGARDIIRANLLAVVDPALSYGRVFNHRSGYEDRFYFDSETNLVDRRLGISSIVLCSLAKDYHGGKNESGEYPVIDFKGASEIYLGRPEIYASPYFQQGVSTVLDRLEELASGS